MSRAARFLQTLDPDLQLRTIDVARQAGCSAQLVRNLELSGVLPEAVRTESGYRVYRTEHVLSALAYRWLAAGIGPAEARQIVRTLHNDPAAALARLDAAHGRLDRQRRDLDAALTAAESISLEPIEAVAAGDAMTVAELAGALGVRPSTLRHWEAEGLIRPDRDRHGARRYAPDQARDARIVHQLRSAGYRIDPLRRLLPSLADPNEPTEIIAGLAAHGDALTVRSRALLDGAAALSALLSSQPADQSDQGFG